MEPPECFSLNTLLKMDVKSGLSDFFPSTAESKFWDFLTKSWEIYCHILPTFGIKLSPQAGAGPRIPIRSGEDVSTMPISLKMSPGVHLLAHVMLTCRGVL